MGRATLFLIQLTFWIAQVSIATWGFLRTFLDHGIATTVKFMLARVLLSMAKTGGYLINLNTALLLLTKCQVLLTRLSMLQSGRFRLSVSLVGQFHRPARYMFTIGALLHISSHLARIIISVAMKSALVHWTHPSLLSGFLLTFISLLIATTAYSQKIKSRCFEIFRYAHYLSYAMAILLILHGQFCYLTVIGQDGRKACLGTTVLWWLIITLALSVTDTLYGCVRARRFFYISKVIEHPSDVVEIQMRTRGNFFFIPGQYIKMNVPDVSRWQWHPFTLTSAPEEDHLSIHVNRSGAWTNKLANALKNVVLEEYKIHVDGPYGCASQEYRHYQAIICIGAGIGQTPFASILKSLWFQLSRRSAAPLCHSFRRIHFVGICRNPQVFSDPFIQIQPFSSGPISCGSHLNGSTIFWQH
jgi:NADPH oxidase